MHKCWLFQFRNTAAMLGIYNLSKLSTIFAASCSLPSVVLCRVSIWSRSSSSTRLRRINDWISFSAWKHQCTKITTNYTLLWHCWLGGRKGIRPVKTEQLGASMVICLERSAYLYMVQLMPLTVSCFSKIQIGITFLVPAHPGSPGQRAVKRVCVCIH